VLSLLDKTGLTVALHQVREFLHTACEKIGDLNGHHLFQITCPSTLSGFPADAIERPRTLTTFHSVRGTREVVFELFDHADFTSIRVWKVDLRRSLLLCKVCLYEVWWSSR
jgi:hypothetical protein